MVFRWLPLPPGDKFDKPILLQNISIPYQRFLVGYASFKHQSLIGHHECFGPLNPIIYSYQFVVNNLRK